MWSWGGGEAQVSAETVSSPPPQLPTSLVLWVRSEGVEGALEVGAFVAAHHEADGAAVAAEDHGGRDLVDADGAAQGGVADQDGHGGDAVGAGGAASAARVAAQG